MPLKSAKRSGVSIPSSNSLLRLAQQVIDERLGMHLFLNVEGRSMDNEIAPVLLIFSPPDKLRIEVGVARVTKFLRFPLLILHHGLMLGGGDILPLLIGVVEGLDGFGGGGFLLGRHGVGKSGEI
jgi:hypothetical protein